MRWANVIAFWVGSLWLGGCVALFLGAARVFGLAKGRAIDSTSQQVGEVFGEMFELWTWFGLGALAVLVLCRLVAWALHARRRRFGVAQIISVLLLALLIVTTLGTARATFAAGEAYRSLEKLDEDDEAAQIAAFADFTAAHVASRKRGEGMVLALLLVVGGLGISLARRDQQAASAPA